MRLHRLQVNAFGPFADTQVVDFDRLSGGGLFLLHGPTGAGKSSVLDAVCYALYGRVPGVRGSARPHLRSDHAADQTRAEVVLELTLEGRRFEVTRRPEWHRPKKRGEGTTIEKAYVALREQVRGEWETLSQRADEVGQKLLDLIGMRLDQFTKVVLLPQGEFAAFLRSDAEARRGLLEQLFNTGRFSDVETWLAERRRELSRGVAAVKVRTDQLLARADEHAAQLALAARPTGDGSSDSTGKAIDQGADESAAGAGTAAARVAELATHAGELAQAAAQEAETVAADAEAAQSVLASARELTTRQLRRAELTEVAQALLSEGPEQEIRRDRLARARRAAPLMTHLNATARLEGQIRRAEATAANAREAVPGSVAGADRPALELARTEIGMELGRLAGTREVQKQLAAQLAQQAKSSARADELIRSAQEAQTERIAAADRCSLARTTVEQLSAAAVSGPAAQANLATYEGIERALGSRARLTAAVEAAEAVVAERRLLAADLKEHWLELRERRLEGIASELAAGLLDGAGCPVCGSTKHPAPAPARARSVAEAAEETAQQRCFDAEQALSSGREHLAELRAALVETRQKVGAHSLATVRARIALAKADLAAAASAAQRLEPLRAQIRDLTDQQESLERLHQQLQAEAAEQSALTAAIGAQTDQLRTQLNALRGQDADVPSRQKRLRGELAAITELLAATDGLAQLVDRLTESVAESQSACRTAGFEDLVEAVEAVLPEAEIEVLAAQISTHDEQVAAVHAQLNEPPLVAAAAAGSPDLPALASAATRAQSRARAAAQEHARLDQARGALERLAAELARHERQDAGLLRESALVDDLARCVEGNGGDNTLRMRLSSYVVAARLEEVAAAATERLLVMSDGRYSLVHTDALARGGIRSGLGLRVLDGWTGVERDTATLSGGESFLASLALALGLADAVQAEAGGAEMQTLFIDEGFGMLDEDTLDEVMTVLDGLREGGRSVGLVSHVIELRARIPAQLEVQKSRHGSQLITSISGAA